MPIGTEISSIIEKAKQVMTKPSEFFEGIKSEEGIEPAFKYFAIIALILMIPLFLLLLVVTFLGLSRLPSRNSSHGAAQRRRGRIPQDD